MIFSLVFPTLYSWIAEKPLEKSIVKKVRSWLVLIAVILLVFNTNKFGLKFENHVSPSDISSPYQNTPSKMREVEKPDLYNGVDNLNKQRGELPSSLEK
jgi:hypothetical protein